MASIEELKANFNLMSIEPKDDILVKCLELCSKYGVTAEDLVDQWSAFAASKFNDTAPTLSALEMMERKELMKKGQEIQTTRMELDLKHQVEPALTVQTQIPEITKSKKRPRSPENDDPSCPITPLTTLNISENHNYPQRSDPLKVLLSPNASENIAKNCKSTVPISVKQGGPESNLLSPGAKDMLKKTKMVVTGINENIEHLAHSTIEKYKLGTPEGIVKETSKKRLRSPENYEENDESSCPIVPSITTLNISDNYNYHQRSDPLKVLLSTNTTENISRNYKLTVPISVKQWGSESNWLSTKAKYMFEKPKMIATIINENIEHLGHSIIERYKLGTPEQIVKETGDIVTFGRICGNSKEKLNPAMIKLEHTWKLGQGGRIILNLSKLPSYALFPGQVVAVKGEVIHGTTVVAHKLYSNVTLSLSSEEVKIQDPLEMIIAAAPFTLNNNIAYEPLQDLLRYAAEKKPHILLLVGPLLDESHEMLADECFMESYDSLFNNLVDCIMTPFKDHTTQVVIVSSQKEISHLPVYPTPPYESRNKYPNLHFVPDPSMLDIGGLIVGVTATDVLLHLSGQEIYMGNAGDRMSRLISHLIEQQSFYPLTPRNFRVSFRHLEKHAMMDVTPHLLILPSTLRYLIKEVNACMVVNPERLTKGYTAGTFAHLRISAPVRGPIFSSTKCDIIQI